MKLTTKKLKNMIYEVLNEAQIGSTDQNLDKLLGTLQSESGPATVAIITAENPPAKVIDPNDAKNQGSFRKIRRQINDVALDWDNSAKMAELRQDLDSLNLEYMEVDGEYFGPELSFLVFDIDKMDAIRLGKKYLQDAIVFGQKMKATNLSDYDADFRDPDFEDRSPDSIMSQSPQGSSKIWMTFTMFNLRANHFSGRDYNYDPSAITDYHVEDERDMVLAGANVQQATNLFTSSRTGKKFQIPFYSDDPGNAPMSDDDLFNKRPITP
tara:strand:+ start:63 stop:866 length:804 start_codon:yes stop_codon:yes gene_type:complete